MRKIILASNSPRRKELLTQLGMEFEVYPSQVEEFTEQTDPAKVVCDLAFQKANQVAHALEEQENIVVLGSDTVVAFDGVILGKPVSKEDALQMLQGLQGRTHQVYTGVALVFPFDDMEPIVFSSCTEVTMYEVCDEELKDYIATGEPMDKAGAYGIQERGGAFVEKIAGDYNTVVGLPVSQVYRVLKELEQKEGK